MLFVNLSEISCANYFIIIIYYGVFLLFAPNQFFLKIEFFFCVLVEENQEAFSEKCSLKLGSHGGDKLHRPPSWPEINVVGTIKDLSASFHRRR